MGWLDTLPEEPQGERVNYLRIIQPTTEKVPDGAEVGSLVDKEDKVYSSLVLILKDVKKQRQLYPMGAKAAVCRSDNGEVPSTDIEAPKSPDCLVCAEAAWGDNGEKPACKDQYRLDCIKATNGEAITLFAKGASIKPTRELINWCKGKGVEHIQFTVGTEVSKGQFQKLKYTELCEAPDDLPF